MRLLRLDGERLASTNFRRKPIPPYAILSHRWGDSEVLYEDLAAGTYKDKAGYRKIEFCGKQAARDGLQHFWIDTCCIDKWDNRELSKAINSMFRWYRNAARCYVFLPDVSAAADASQSTWEASFRASEWFTRGWTLQELVAPLSVEFFSCEGRRIGDKTSLEPLVHETTGIPLTALRNGALDEFTVDERKGWAKNRKTTEEEDAVYCLLGILDVDIPAAYGEGVGRAWRRLQMELEAAGSAPSIIPFSQNDQFVGRKSQLAELEAKLFGHNQAATMAIVGPPGTGKSQLALEVAHRTKQRKKNCSVFWIDASNIDSLYRSYAGIAQKLNITGWDDEKADCRQLVKAHLSGKGERQCLLVFDNADDIDLESSRLSDYIPQSEQCAVLYTTTTNNMAERLAAPDVVELKEMTRSTAQRMLENCIRSSLSRSEQQEAQSLLRELFYLPLAIALATAYINTRNITMQEYRSLVARQKEAVPGRDSELPENGPQEHDGTDPVAITLLISLDQIRSDGELAADYLSLAACVDRKDIPLGLLPASSSRQREEAVKVLSGYGLVTRRPAESSVDLHQLVHRALRGWLQKQRQLEKWTENAVKELCRMFPGNDYSSRSKWRRLLPHAKHVLLHSQSKQEGGHMLELAWKSATALYNDGWWREAELLDVQVMETRKRVLGNEHPNTLVSIGNLASTYRNQGRWKEAEPLEVQVMEAFKRVLGNEHPSTLTSMGNLASTYRNQGRWKEAEQLEVQVMETRKIVLGEEHPDTLTSMGNLASTYRNQGRWKEAEQLEVQVMETRRIVLGEEHPSTLTSMGNPASTYINQCRWKEAELLCVQMMETRLLVFGDEHPDTLTSMFNLAFTLKGQGLYNKAVLLLEQCCQMQQQVLGLEHPHTVLSFKALQAWRASNGSLKLA